MDTTDRAIKGFYCIYMNYIDGTGINMDNSELWVMTLNTRSELFIIHGL